MLIFSQQNPQPAGAFTEAQWIITKLQDDKFCLVLSGIVEVDFITEEGPVWRRDTLRIIPNMTPIFAYAGYDGFSFMTVEQYACYGGVSAFWDEDEAVNMGFAVDSFRPFFSAGNRNFFNGSGIDLSVGVRDSDAQIIKVAYHLMAIGKITQGDA